MHYPFYYGEQYFGAFFFFLNIAILQCLSRGLKVGFIAVVTYSVTFVCVCASPNVHLKQALSIINTSGTNETGSAFVTFAEKTDENRNILKYTGKGHS